MCDFNYKGKDKIKIDEKNGEKESTENDPLWRDNHCTSFSEADNAMQTREDNLVLVH